MSVSTYEGDWAGTGMRFRRSGRDTVHEADVYDGEVPELDDVHLKDCVLLKFPSAPPSLRMGDFLVLESMDGHSQWEADVRCREDPKFFEARNDPLYIDSILVCVNDGKGSKLLHRSKQIFVLPAPNSTSSSTNNVSGAGLQKTNEARPGEVQNMAKAKIKIGINGCGRIARTMVKIALNSQDLELVAINDPLLSSMDQKTCMFRHHHPDQGWRSDFTMKDPTTLMFSEKEDGMLIFSILFPSECDKIPWNETGTEYIVKVLNYDKDTDDKEVRTSKYPHYSPNASPLQNSLAPLAKVLHDKFGMVEGMSTAVRVPVLIHIEPESHEAAAAIGEVLPLWKGRFRGLMLQVPTIDAPPNNIGIELAQFKEYGLISSNTRPSDGFNVLFGWCVEMAHQIPEVMYCQLNFK
ncbi:hypothetical protein PR202_ga13365 [Eleusine coracana subsp. coracana]|uniref:glyceraldehyde-3-phosphate dehydrogenase (phosphorylating) n=1 Tax=Eleusine coracana subsp. coracana TaxID=191504 RepID=A0AAV5CEL1_ELECO|nr:hypothetical protein PR202_ga13365 [Eleusine coracana subsp. coracana]